MSIEGSSRISPASVVIRSKATGTLRVFDASRTRIRLISMGPPERRASCSGMLCHDFNDAGTDGAEAHEPDADR